MTVLAVARDLPSARFASLFALLGLLLASGACSGMAVGRPARPIPSVARNHDAVPTELLEHGRAQRQGPLPSDDVPANPYMARNGASCMHSDASTTNTYDWPGPTGEASEVVSRANGYLGGECPTINFDRQGRLVTVCLRYRTPSLLLMDPHTLQVLDRRTLPSRRGPLLRLRALTNDTSGGAYFYLDHQDRAIVGTADGTLDVISVRDGAEGPRFALDQRIDLRRALALPDGETDKITAVLPDWQGNYWFVAREGTIGIATRDGHASSIRLPGEEIENSFSVAEEGAYVVSDHALYLFERGPDGRPRARWRETYDRGTRRKVGQINQGSGTTPTLLGRDYVAIGDNAEPRMNVLVYRRGEGVAERRICRTPVFAPGASATENTLIGHGRSLVVENNAGYDIFFTMRHGRTSSPGLARVDVRPDESGCDVVWTNDTISQTTVPKLSTATGLIYAYTKMPDAPYRTDAYYFTGIDFRTGHTVFRVLTGTGLRYDNHWAAITLAPDGSAYVGVLNGLVRIRDGR